jgi:hypothetical protein
VRNVLGGSHGIGRAIVTYASANPQSGARRGRKGISPCAEGPPSLRSRQKRRRVPEPDPETGALRPSGVQDFANGGGSRAFLFSYGRPFVWTATVKDMLSKVQRQ